MRRYRPRITSNARDIVSKARRCYICDRCLFRHYVKPALTCAAPGCNGSVFLHFDSCTEADRWAALLMLDRAGIIKQLRRQTRFVLLAWPDTADEGQIEPRKVGVFISDFDYVVVQPQGEQKVGQFVVEDVKGDLITDLSSWKHRHFKAQFGYEITIT